MPRSTSQLELVGPLIMRGPRRPSEYWRVKWLWYQVVPYVVARKRYVKDWPGGIGPEVRKQDMIVFTLSDAWGSIVSSIVFHEDSMPVD